MGNPYMGRYASVKLDATLVANLGNWKLALSAAEIDVSAFGTSWEKKMPGMQGWTATLTGMFDPSDTTGQAALLTAKINATKLQNIRLYIDSTSYWTIASTDDTANGAYISAIDIDHDKAGVAQVTVTVLGFGQIKLI